MFVLGNANNYLQWDFILELRNSNREFYNTNKIIDKFTHYKFMTEHCYDYRICYSDDIEVGFIGHVLKDIRLAVHSKYRRLGVAKFMLSTFMLEFQNCHTTIKIDNYPSLSLFESCGFIQTNIGLQLKND